MNETQDEIDEALLKESPDYQAAELAGWRLVEKLGAFPDKAERIKKEIERNNRLLKNLREKILGHK